MTTASHNHVQGGHNVHSRQHETNHPNYALRRTGAALGLLAVAVSGGLLAKKGIDALNSRSGGPHFTQEQLDKMPQRSIVLDPGNSAESVLRSVEPEVLTHGQERADLVSYIQEQGANADGQLAEHQLVNVPLVPGVEHLDPTAQK
jgi:hypothetical protein